MQWTRRKKNKAAWHRWFAWYPVRVNHYEEYVPGGDTRTCIEYVWLEPVLRKVHWAWTHREVFYRTLVGPEVEDV